jgi:hypothetical protein
MRMPKFKVRIEYAVWHYEEHEVEIDPEDVEEFHEFPNDYCCEETRKLEDTGDVIDNTWKETVEEICVLDQIVAAVEADVTDLKFTTVAPGDLLGLPYREESDDA